MSSNSDNQWHATTILTVRKGGKVVIAGDGQVSIGRPVMKATPARCAAGRRQGDPAGSPGPRPTPSPCSSGWKQAGAVSKAS